MLGRICLGNKLGVRAGDASSELLIVGYTLGIFNRDDATGTL